MAVLPYRGFAPQIAQSGVAPSNFTPQGQVIDDLGELNIPIQDNTGNKLPVGYLPPPVQTTQQPQQSLPQYGLGGAMNTLQGTYQQGMNNLMSGRSGALGALQGTRQDLINQQGVGMGALQDAYNQASQNVSGGLSQLNQAGNRAGQYINQGLSGLRIGQQQGLNLLGNRFNQARGELGGYQAGGRQATDLQAQLSGAMGSGAQQAAMSQVMNSPEFDFIREQGLREINANAAATGGTQGGEVLRDLTRFGQGLASQRFDTAFNRLGNIANRGLGVASQLSGLSAQEGQAGSNLIQNMQSAAANLRGQGAGIQSALGQAGASLKGQLAGIAGQTGMGMSNLAQNIGGQMSALGRQAADTYATTGQQASNLANILGQTGAQYQMQTGRDLSQALQGQSGALSDLVNRQGMAGAGQMDQFAANLSDLLSGQGNATADDRANMARLLANLATQNASTGSTAIGNYGDVASNAALAQGGNNRDLIRALFEEFGGG